MTAVPFTANLPTERERRSRVNWFDVLPRHYAEWQMWYERRQTALALRNAGMTFSQVADWFGGISLQSARRLVIRAKKDLRAPSPAEYWYRSNARPEFFTPTEKHQFRRYFKPN